MVIRTHRISTQSIGRSGREPSLATPPAQPCMRLRTRRFTVLNKGATRHASCGAISPMRFYMTHGDSSAVHTAFDRGEIWDRE